MIDPKKGFEVAEKIVYKKAGLIAFEIVQQFKTLDFKTDAQRFRWLKQTIMFVIKRVRMERHPYSAGFTRGVEKAAKICDQMAGEERCTGMPVELAVRIRALLPPSGPNGQL